jgi:hypothetical protein
MYKALCVAAVVAGLLALSGRSSSAAPAPFTSPLIVAKGKLINQTASIPTTTIFTPPQNGLYRLSVYATISRNDPNSGSDWIVNVQYADDGGQGNFGSLLYSYNSVLGQFTYEDVFSNVGGPTITFEAKAGTSVTYNVTSNGPPDNSAYSLYYTLERME